MASNLYKSYGQKGGRFKDSDPGYGALTELRRQNETQIRAHKQNASAIENQQRQWLGAKQKSEAAELGVRDDIRNFERKAEDLKIQNIRIASKQILERGKDEAKHHIEVGKLLSSISESAGKIGSTVASAWEEAGDDLEKAKADQLDLDSDEVQGAAANNKKIIEEYQKEQDKDRAALKAQRDDPNLNQEITGLPSQSSLLWHKLGFSNKLDKFNSQLYSANKNLDTAIEEWQANNGAFDKSSKEAYQKDFSKFAETYLRKHGGWDSMHESAIKLKEALKSKISS